MLKDSTLFFVALHHYIETIFRKLELSQYAIKALVRNEIWGIQNIRRTSFAVTKWQNLSVKHAYCKGATTNFALILFVKPEDVESINCVACLGRRSWIRRFVHSTRFSGIPMAFYGRLMTLDYHESNYIIPCACSMSRPGSQTCGPRATCGRRGHFVPPAMLIQGCFKVLGQRVNKILLNERRDG